MLLLHEVFQFFVEFRQLLGDFEFVGRRIFDGEQAMCLVGEVIESHFRTHLAGGISS